MYSLKKIVTGISCLFCLFNDSLVETDAKSDGNPIIFLASAMEIPLALVQNPCHVPAWETNKSWINDME